MHHDPCQEFMPRPNRSRWRVFWSVLLTVIVTVPVAVVGSLAFSEPSIAYRIRNGTLEIHGGEGLFSNHRTVPLATIREASEVRLRGGRRVFGTGLPGYCAGRFSYEGLGSVWQVTDCRREVLMLRAEGEPLPLLVTPPDYTAFLAALRAGSDGDFSPAPIAPSSLWTVLKVLLVLVVLPSALFVPLAAFGAPRRLRYRLESGELVVQLLVFRKRFPLAGRTARRHTPAKAWKRAGSSLPGYHAGFFSVDGQPARVYASVIKAEGVMLEGEPRVFVTPADPEAFLAALHRHGVRTVDSTR